MYFEKNPQWSLKTEIFMDNDDTILINQLIWYIEPWIYAMLTYDISLHRVIWRTVHDLIYYVK